MPVIRAVRFTVFGLVVLLVASAAFAQQTGSISGVVSTTDGSVLPGVTVEARSNVLPQARTAVTDETGTYRLPALQPGVYTLTFTLAGLETQTRTVTVLLGQDVPANAKLGVAGVAESITVTASSTLIDTESTEIKSAVSEELIEDLPIGQEYRDLIKLAPAVQLTQDAIRGPSAGGSGQDNVYQFDGVNVTLPLFGTLSAEPSSHDIQQISVVKGGAQAIDFNRAAGFTIDSVSKSGTSEFHGEVGYQFQTESMRGDAITPTNNRFDQSQSWLTANLGGPILRDRLFFYASYYRPEVERTNRVNAYGEVPDYDSTRDEIFGKATFTPLSTILLNASYRTSDRAVDAASVGSSSQASTRLNEEAEQNIAILEGSWIIGQSSLATFKYTDYENLTASVPAVVVDNFPSTTPGTTLDINNLDQYGLFAIPSPINNQPAFNTFIQPLIDRYGFVNAAGVRAGGGEVGAGSQFNFQDFLRESAQFGYDFTIGSGISHDLHVGYQWSKDSEDLRRTSNGWGVISVPGGRVNFTPPGGTATPVFYQAQFTRSIVADNNIHSEYVSHNIEVNDSIRWNDWTFNVGVLLSNDSLYGQGLREADTLSGFEVAVGNKYKMYEIPWDKTIQPRVGATWAYNGSDNVYASYAKYVPAASSLPRAASWDRNILGATTRLHFDQSGVLIGAEQLGGSTGKLFQDDLDPRYTDEYLIGTSQQISPTWAARAYGRYRYSSNFWEDTRNNARELWAPEGYPKDLYIPNLIDQLRTVGIANPTNSAYVIAELDGAFTKYYEATVESDWRGGNTFVRGSYTWSHYYGNFDQDNTSLDFNDSAIFIGSSALADAAGQQIWDNKYGDLRGDRRHLLKLYGSYQLPWNGTVGAFGIYQSGQPWEAWNYEVYRTLPGFGTSTSDQARYGEPAGSRRSPAHYQVDLSYTQQVPLFQRYGITFQLDAFNIFDKQTGYNFEPSVHRTAPTLLFRFGEPREHFDPRRYQAAVRFQF